MLRERGLVGVERSWVHYEVYLVLQFPHRHD